MKPIVKRYRVFRLAIFEGLALTYKSKDHIELLYEDGRWLMNCAYDSLTCGSQFPQETNDGVGGVAIQAARGLIEEQQQARLCRELYTNGQSLFLLDTQARDQSILDILEFE
jgi:hypothetical protein